MMYRYPEPSDEHFRVVFDESMSLAAFSSYLYLAGTFSLEHQKPVQIMICRITTLTDRKMLCQPHFAYQIKPKRSGVIIDVQPSSAFAGDDWLNSGASFWLHPDSAMNALSDLIPA